MRNIAWASEKKQTTRPLGTPYKSSSWYKEYVIIDYDMTMNVPDTDSWLSLKNTKQNHESTEEKDTNSGQRVMGQS